MTVARQAPLSMGILQARILKWIAMSSSRGSSQPRDRTQVAALQAGSLPSEPPEKLHGRGRMCGNSILSAQFYCEFTVALKNIGYYFFKEV